MIQHTPHRLRSRGGLLYIVCAAAVIGLAGPAAFAQQSGGELTEITVTATKRDTTVQNTPISITAVTGEDLLARGISDFIALAEETPGISLKTSGPGQTEFEMRGLDSNGGSSPTVGFYLDDVPLTAPAFAANGKVVIDPNLYDLNRVEVLRGPQGTLYGSGSMGGTIKLVTNQPDLTTYQASAETVFSDTDGGGFNHGVNAMVNLPLVTNELAIRLVGTESHTSGWIDRKVLNPFPLETEGFTNRGNTLGAPVQYDFKDANWEELYGGRISALYKPNDRLTLGATLFYQGINQGGENNYDSDPGTLAHYQPFNVPEPYADTYSLGSINANYKFDGFDVTSVTADWTRHSAITQDESEVLYALFGLPGFSIASGGVGPASISEHDYSRQFSEELRVASSGDNRLQWLGGLFYSSYTSELDYYSFVNGLIPFVGTSDLIDENTPATINQKAAFGELTYKVADGLKVTGGLRYYYYNSEVPNAESGAITPTGGPAFFRETTAAKDHGVDPKVNVSYDINKDLMVYGNAERGFRPGGGNPPVPTTGPLGDKCLTNLKDLGETSVPISFDPDSVWSYELGEKFKIGNTLTLNGAIYHERWSSVQQQVVLPCGFAFYGNFGTAVVNGGELEANAFLTSNWQATVNVGYAHSYFTENNSATGTVEGQPVQDVPLVTASGSLTYFFPVKADWRGSVRGSYDWTDSRYEPVSLAVLPSSRLPSYGFAGLRATVFNDRWALAVFVNNLTNKHAELEVQPTFSAFIPAYFRIVTNQPLTAGIDLNVKF